MKIIEYEDKYLEDVKDLLVELEKYILSIDKDNLDQLHPEYREKMAILDLEEKGLKVNVATISRIAKVDRRTAKKYFLAYEMNN